jgi:hypothetical protein
LQNSVNKKEKKRKKPKKRKKNSKEIFFFSNIAKIFTTQKILKMENKHPEHFWSA